MDQYLQFMQSIHFENPHLIWWRSPMSFGCIALVAAIVVTVIVWRLWWRGRVQAIEGYGNPDLVARWTALPKQGFAWLTLAALVSMLVLGLTAATMPYQSLGAVSVPSGTVRIVAVFDGSRSMGAENRDEPPVYGGKSCTLVEGPCGRRIETARLILLNQVMPTIKGNQLGVVVYSGAAVAKSALTNDFVPIETMLTTGWVDIGTGMGEGTYLHDGLNTAIKVLQRNPAKSGESDIILLFTDGENHSKPEELQAAIDNVRKIGATLIVVGVGSTNVSYIPLYSTDGKPLYDKDGKRSYHKMADGTVAETARDDAFMRELAEAARGRYLEASQSLNFDWPTSFAGSRVEIAKKYWYGPLVASIMVILAFMWLAGPIASRNAVSKAASAARSGMKSR